MVAGEKLAVFFDAGEPLAGVVVVAALVAGTAFVFQVSAGGVAVGGAFVAVPLGEEWVAGPVFPRARWVRAALAVVDGVVAVVLFGPSPVGP